MTPEELKRMIALNMALGYAMGVIQATLWWDLPKGLREKLQDALLELKEKEQLL
jgi:hypothetical protein